MKSKAYRAVDVNGVDVGACLRERAEAIVHAGLDIGKESIFCTLRWSVDDFDRPWRAGNPSEVGRLAELLAEVGRGRRLVVAMEPTGTYGDALRQALERHGVAVHRVSPKNASDYAEVFDGVPSQHDGKDAAVVAELAAQGRCWPWPLPRPTEADQEVSYHVQWLDGQRRQMMVWCGRVEALLSRHWPEATSVVPLLSGTLLRCLATYGGPGGLAAAADGVARVRGWGGHRLSGEKAQALVASARQTAGLVMGRWEEEQLRRCAEQIRVCRQEMQASRRRLRELTRGHAGIAALGPVVGVPTACVLWSELGDPRLYSCGAAYRKAMGLNLAERSSGKWQGRLKISKRGSSMVRRWLYMAALRWLKTEPVRSWYLRQKASRRGEGKAAVVGVMRKLALALYCVGGRGEKFDAKQLYQSVTRAVN
jgi:transposase